MRLESKLLDINKAFGRPGLVREATMGIVLHWPAKPNQSAEEIRNFWNSKFNTSGASANFIIDGDLCLETVPKREKAIHCGSAQLDPVSGKYYTDIARELFGDYAANLPPTDPKCKSPNRVTIGIEMCHTDWDGRFSDKTLDTSAWECANLCKEFALDPMKHITTHHLVVGWKDCPKWFVDHPDELAMFLIDVESKWKQIR